MPAQGIIVAERPGLSIGIRLAYSQFKHTNGVAAGIESRNGLSVREYTIAGDRNIYVRMVNPVVFLVRSSRIPADGVVCHLVLIYRIYDKGHFILKRT